MPLPGFEPGPRPPQGLILSGRSGRFIQLDHRGKFIYLGMGRFINIYWQEICMEQVLLEKAENKNELNFEKELKCTSCKRRLTNLKGSTVFNCPNCGKYEIVRCFYCRRLATKYICPACSFSGPN